MDALVLRVAILVLALAFPAWIALSLAVVLGRMRSDRRQREVRGRGLSTREAGHLLRRAAKRPRTE